MLISACPPPGFRASVVYVFVSTPGMLAVVNSVLAAILATAAYGLGARVALVVVAGGAGFVASLGLLVRQYARTFEVLRGTSRGSRPPDGHSRLGRSHPPVGWLSHGRTRQAWGRAVPHDAGRPRAGRTGAVRGAGGVAVHGPPTGTGSGLGRGPRPAPPCWRAVTCSLRLRPIAVGARPQHDLDPHPPSLRRLTRLAYGSGAARRSEATPSSGP